MSDEDDIAKRRDETIKRMFATPPKPHKSEPKRRQAPSSKVTPQPKQRTNRPRKSKP